MGKRKSDSKNETPKSKKKKVEKEDEEASEKSEEEKDEKTEKTSDDKVLPLELGGYKKAKISLFRGVYYIDLRVYTNAGKPTTKGIFDNLYGIFVIVEKPIQILVLEI